MEVGGSGLTTPLGAVGWVGGHCSAPRGAVSTSPLFAIRILSKGLSGFAFLVASPRRGAALNGASLLSRESIELKPLSRIWVVGRPFDAGMDRIGSSLNSLSGSYLSRSITRAQVVGLWNPFSFDVEQKGVT